MLFRSRYDKVIDNPQYKFYPTWYGNSDRLRVCRIALSSTETRVEFEYTNTVYNRFNVERGTYIKASGTNKLAFIRAENIAIAPSNSTFEKSGEILKFALIFPAIPQKANNAKADNVFIFILILLYHMITGSILSDLILYK